MQSHGYESRSSRAFSPTETLSSMDEFDHLGSNALEEWNFREDFRINLDSPTDIYGTEMPREPGRDTPNHPNGLSDLPQGATKPGHSTPAPDLATSMLLDSGSSETDSTVAPEKADVQMWTPFALRRFVISTFVLGCITVMVALCVLFAYSTTHHGICVVEPRFKYSWTYVPTSVFTLFAIFWSQVEYRSKQMFPWARMAIQPCPSTHTILADYISPMVLKTLYNSLKSRHFVVSSAVAVGMLIKIATVVSTGLLVTTVVNTTKTSIPLAITAKLDDSNGSTLDSMASRSFGESAVITLSSLWHNTSLPFGTTDRYVFDTFEALDGNNANLTGRVNLFSVRMQCEIADFTLNANQDMVQAEYTPTTLAGRLMSQSWSANIEGISMQNRPGENNTLVLSATIGDAAGFAECHERHANGSTPCMTFALGHYSHSDNSTRTRPSQLYDSLGALCRPEYTMSKADVKIADVVSAPADVVEIEETTRIFNASSYMLMASLDASIGKIEWAIGTSKEAKSGLDYFWALLNNTGADSLPSRFDPPHLFDHRKVITGLELLHNSIISQLVARYFKVPTAENVTGMREMQEIRLAVVTISFWLLEGCLALCVVLALFVTFSAPSMSASHDPSTIGGLATILARSTGLMESLSGTGTASVETLGEILSNSKFWTSFPEIGVVKGFNIEEQTPADTPAKLRTTPETEESIVWRRPFSFSVPGRILFVIAPLLALAGLEITHRYSQAHAGIANVDLDSTDHYYWTLLPTMVLAGIALLPGILDFELKLNAPYSVLRHKVLSAPHSMTENYLGKLAIHSFYMGCLKRQYAIVSISFATIAAPFLTIFVSNCFSRVSISSSQSATLLQVDSFQLASKSHQYQSPFDNTLSDPNAGMSMANLVFGYNVSYPPLTHNDIVLPAFEIVPGTGTMVSSSSTFIKARVLALRPISNCTVAPANVNTSAICADSVGTFQNFLNESFPHVGKAYPGPYKRRFSCYRGNPYGEDPEYGTPSTAMPDMLFGQWVATTSSSLDVEADNQKYGTSWVDGGANCPLAVASFGRVVGNVTTEATTLLCKPYVERVEADVEFEVPDSASREVQLRAAARAPGSPAAVVVDDTSAAFYSDAAQTNSIGCVGSGSDADILLATPKPFNAKAMAAAESLDDFFLAAVYGPNGVPAAEMSGEKGVEKLIAGIQTVYGTYMAQIINTQRSRNGTGPATFVNASIVNPNVYRLVQDERSTRVLEGLLALIAVSMVVAFGLADTKDVLPKNPCSIAAVASLLADSELLKLIPPGSEWLSVTELERKVFEGCVFSMGWRGEGPDRRFGIDISS